MAVDVCICHSLSHNVILFHFGVHNNQYYNADDFCGSWFSENYIENALNRESWLFVFKILASDKSCLRGQ